MPGVASFNSVFIDVLPAQNRRNPRLVIEIFGVMPPKTNLADKAPELDHSRALPADPRDPDVANAGHVSGVTTPP